MSFKIGFAAGTDKEETEIETQTALEEPVNGEPKPSVVRVYFEERDRAYSYYNEDFDLHIGDWVWVEGKLAGMLGRVVEISYNFKIKLSDYMRVIGVADTKATGELSLVGPYFVTGGDFLPFSKVRTSQYVSD